jgi:hypothetical protein
LSPAGLFFTPCAFPGVCLGTLYNISAPTVVATQATAQYAINTNYFFQAAPAFAGFAVTVTITSLSTEFLGCGSSNLYPCDPFYVLSGNAGPFAVTAVAGAGAGILQYNLFTPMLACPTASQCVPAVGALAGAWGAPISMQLASDAGTVGAGARVLLNVIPCPAASYCPNGAFAPVPCPAGSFCPAASSAPTVCPATTSSPANSTSAVACSLSCPAGSFCPSPPGPAGVCSAGTYSSSAGATSCAACTAPPGSHCAAGSASAAGAPCPPGFSCAGGSAPPTPCSCFNNCGTAGTAAEPATVWSVGTHAGTGAVSSVAARRATWRWCGSCSRGAPTLTGFRHLAFCALTAATRGRHEAVAQLLEARRAKGAAAWAFL